MALLMSISLTACEGLFDFMPGDTCDPQAAMITIQSSELGAFKIDAYEVSRSTATALTQGTGTSLACVYERTIPWSGITFADAKAACEDAGKRLCTLEEWQTACQTDDKMTYPYGNEYNAETCNGDATIGSVSPTGLLAECKTSNGIFDMSGNLREWVAEGILAGGSYNANSDELKCTATLDPTDPLTYQPTSSDGFRCCDDASIN